MRFIKKRDREGAPVGWLFLALVLAGCTPPGPRALLEGQRLVERGRYSEAVEKLKTATALLSTNAAAWNYLGLACQYAGQPAEAEQAYQRALACNHDLMEARYNLGCLWLAEDKFDGARTQLTAYTLRRGNSVEALLKLGAAQSGLRDWNGAEKSFNEALRLGPPRAEAWNGLGMIHAQRGRAAEAVQDFNRALKLRANFGPALLNVAIVSHRDLKDHALALQRYRDYLALKPAPANAAAVAVVARQLELELSPPAPPPPPLTATQAAPNALPAKPTVTNSPRPGAPSKPNPAPATNPAKVPQAAPASPTTNTVSARLPLETAAKTTPDPQAAAPPLATNRPPPRGPQTNGGPGFLQRINPLNLLHGDAQPAKPPAAAPAVEAAAAAANPAPSGHYVYRSLAKPAPGDHTLAEHSFAVGVQAQQAHRLAEAMTAYRKATEQDPAYFEAYYNLGLASLEAGYRPAALLAFESALAIRPESLDARVNFAQTLRQANLIADAVTEFEKVLAQYPNETRCHLALGNLYASQLRQPAKARPHYLKVLETDPRNAQADAVRYWLAANPP